jgi:hypothetical protein
MGVIMSLKKNSYLQVHTEFVDTAAWRKTMLEMNVIANLKILMNRAWLEAEDGTVPDITLKSLEKTSRILTSVL